MDFREKIVYVCVCVYTVDRYEVILLLKKEIVRRNYLLTRSIKRVINIILIVIYTYVFMRS